MARTPAPSSPQGELHSLLDAAKAGKPKPVYLFVGESSDTRAAANALIDLLVPPASRSFNLESYDGRATPVSVVIDSLRMRGFFAGTKVVWLRESPVLLSGEKRSEVAKSMFVSWADSREADAIGKLVTLVALAGWDQKQFDEIRWSSATKTKQKEVFGDDLDAEELAQVEAIQAAAVERGEKVGAYQDESTALLDFLESGLPPQTVLLFTASDVDGRKRIVKRIKELGGSVDLSVTRERSGALTREAVEELIRSILPRFGKKLAPDAHDLLLRRAGTDSALLSRELEKLCLYVGDEKTIREADVSISVRDLAESWIFDFTAALSSRNAAKALPLLRGLFEQGEPPLRLLAMVARELRMLLIARECLDSSLRGKWRANLPYPEFQSRLLSLIDADTQAAFGKAHPFVLYRRFQDAAAVAASDLRRALIELARLDLRLKSSGGSPAILVEAFVLQWCRRVMPAGGSSPIR